jgi:LysM repeat protein
MNSGSNSWKQEPDRQGRPSRRPPPILGGLIAAVLVALTLSASMVLGAQEQALIAFTAPTATATRPLPSATPSPIRPTSTPVPTIRPTLPSWAYPAAITLAPLSTRTLVTPTKLPAVKPTSSPTPRKDSVAVLCRKPQGWVTYTIRRGDTLTTLAASYRTTVKRLKDANCLRGETIYTGTSLWVPFRLSPTATKRPTRTRTPTSTPATATPDTATPTAPVTASATGTKTPEPPATYTNTPGTPTATGTSVPPTATTEPTDTPVPATASNTPPPTKTPAPPTDTPVPTNTPVPPTPTKKPPTNTPLPPTSIPTETDTP